MKPSRKATTSWPSASPSFPTPTWCERLREHAPLNEVDKATMYGGGAKGYTDYPALA
jgi:N-ethylmaleimide reductase